MVCTLAALGWQRLTVHANYGGDWTGLFCIGGTMPQPPELAESIWQFRGSDGYDGQWYHLIAHDPWRQRGFDRFLDNPRVRYRRILLPALAHMLAGGKDRLVHAAYLGLLQLCVFLGCFWISRYAALAGASPWIGCGFLLVPAVLISIDRLTVDGALACLCAGFVWYRTRPAGWPLYLLLAAAPLVRETGFLLLAGYLLELLFERRYRRAAIFATAAAPAAAWWWTVVRSTPAQPVALLGPVPLGGWLARVLHPVPYSFDPTVSFAATALDYLALAGILWSMVLAFRLALGRPARCGAYAALLFAVAAVFLQQPDIWLAVYAFGRVLTPLLLLVALTGVAAREWRLALPMLLVTPRIVLQIVPQVLQVVRGLAGRAS